MTRRSSSGRTTPRGTASGRSRAATGENGSVRTSRAAARTDESAQVSLRRRKPLAFWMAVIGAAAVILTTFGSLLSAFS